MEHQEIKFDFFCTTSSMVDLITEVVSPDMQRLVVFINVTGILGQNVLNLQPEFMF